MILRIECKESKSGVLYQGLFFKPDKLETEQLLTVDLTALCFCADKSPIGIKSMKKGESLTIFSNEKNDK